MEFRELDYDDRYFSAILFTATSSLGSHNQLNQTLLNKILNPRNMIGQRENCSFLNIMVVINYY